MKQLFTVLKFELAQKLKQKSFIFSIVLICLIFLSITFAPKLINSLDDSSKEVVKSSDKSEKITEPKEKKEKLLLLISGNISEKTLKALGEKYDITKAKDENELKEKIKNEEFKKGLLLTSDITAKLYAKQEVLFNISDKDEIKEVLKENYLYNILLEKEGITKESYQKINSFDAQIETKNLGKNLAIGYGISYLALFFLYFSILLNGQSISTNVAKEKDSRTMELLVTNVKPSNLIIGKVLAGVISTLIQVFVLIFTIYVGYKINLESIPEVSMGISYLLGNIKLIDIVILLNFIIFGVLMYYFLFAAFGSLVNRLDELNQALAPITIIIVIAFMVPMMSMSNPSSSVMKIASLVPFTSPLAIIPRYLMTTMPITEVILSFVILLLTTLILLILSFKVYRQGTLNYGNKLNVWKILTTKNK